jgi:hypothetical protein
VSYEPFLPEVLPGLGAAGVAVQHVDHADLLELVRGELADGEV